MATLLEMHHPDLWNLNPGNPQERATLEDGYRRIETQLARQNKLVENDTYTLGHKHSERQIATRDRTDAILSELHSLLYAPRDGSTLEVCRSLDCHATALPPFEGSGYCATCLAHAKAGTAPEFDKTSPAKAIVGSPFGR
jgi:hypothetical protein